MEGANRGEEDDPWLISQRKTNRTTERTGGVREENA